jgi:outer membrane protein assembly factor BamD (BamD/ComL family)
VVLSRGDAIGAIAQLDAYDRAHPNGPLERESMALRIQALRNSGKLREARVLAKELEVKYPGHRLLPQVTGDPPR